MSADDRFGPDAGRSGEEPCREALLTEASLSAWRANPDPVQAAVLCSSATAAEPPWRRALFLSLGKHARSLFPEDVSVLLAVSRMYIVLSALGEAQSALVRATQLAPDDARIFALLGQVLLRLGDARSAAQAYDQATARGLTGPATQLLRERARHYVGMQDEHGERAVAEAVQREFAPKEESRPPSSDRPTSDPPGARRSVGRSVPHTLIGIPSPEPPGDGGRAPRTPVPSPADVERALAAAEADLAALAGAARGALVRHGGDGEVQRRTVADSAVPTPETSDATRYAVIRSHRSGSKSKRGSTRPWSSEPAPAPRREPTGRRSAEARPEAYRDYGLERPLPAHRIASRLPQNDVGDAASDDDVFDRQTVPALELPVQGEPPASSPPDRGAAKGVTAPLATPAAATGLLGEATPEPPSRDPSTRPAATAEEMETSTSSAAPTPIEDEVAKPRAEPAASSPAPPPSPAPPSPSPPPSPAPSPSVPAEASEPTLILSPPPPAGEAAKGRSSRPPPATRRARRVAVAAALAVMLVGGVQVGRWLERADAARVASGLVGEADAALHTGRPRGFVDAEAALVRAKQAVDSGLDVALAFTRLRALRALDADESGVTALAEAIAEARRSGATDADVAAAEIVLFSLGRDSAKVDELLAKHDGTRHASLAATAFYELAAGAALERRGDARAIERYQAAVRADRALFPAEVRLVRALLLFGDAAEGRRRARAMPPDRPETVVLLALANRVEGPDAPSTATAAPGPFPPEDDLPRTLKSVARGLALARGLDTAGQAAAFAAAVAASDAPHAAVLCGDLALESGEVASAELAAQRALELAPDFGAGLGLAVRAALVRGQLDRAREHTQRMTGREGAVARAMIAYEQGDAEAAFDAARAVVPPPDPEGALDAALQRLRGVALAAARVQKLARSSSPWEQLVAVDALLDAGETERARDVMDRWKEPAQSRAYALRLARVLRYEGRYDDARRLLDLAGTAGTALVERALLAGELKSERQSTLAALDTSVIPERHFLFAYLRARQGVLDKAERIVSALDLPSPDAPRSLRLAAALALSQLPNDERGRSLCRDLWEQYPNDPDVLRAAVGFGLAPKTALRGR